MKKDYNHLSYYNLKIQYLTTSMEQNSSRECNSYSPNQEISHFYETQRFLTVFTRAQKNLVSLIPNPDIHDPEPLLSSSQLCNLFM